MKLIVTLFVLLNSAVSLAEDYDWYTATMVESIEECVLLQEENVDRAVFPEEITEFKVEYKEGITIPEIEIEGSTVTVYPGYMESMNMCVYIDRFYQFIDSDD